MTMQTIDIETMVQHYLIAALWAETDEDGEPLHHVCSIADVSPECVAQARKDCQDFIDACGPELVAAMLVHYRESGMASHPDMGSAEACFGHDFLLTRNGHGAGFWDRGAGEVGDRISDICRQNRRFWECDFYVGDDGRVYSTTPEHHAPMVCFSQDTARALLECAEALRALLPYTKACESLLNATPAGQIRIAEEALAKLNGEEEK